MKKTISQLSDSLKQAFDCSKWRADCFSQLLLGIVTVCSVNLKMIALCFIGTADTDSHYRRIQRFFSEFKMDFDGVSRWLFKLFFNPHQKIYVIIDRTDWFWGKSKINIFMCSIAYEGLAIPIVWTMLPKAGTSSAKEQITLLNRFVRLFGAAGMLGLLADREFANGALFAWCEQNAIPFYIRIKHNTAVRIKNKKITSAGKLFKNIPAMEARVFPLHCEVFGQKIYLVGARSEKDERMIVATNANPRNAIAIYLRPWEIECLFQSLKNRGFRFEETHMTSLERIEKLMALLAIGFAWAHKLGEWQATIKPPTFKRFYNTYRLQHSLFRTGLNYLRRICIQKSHPQLQKAIRFIFHNHIPFSHNIQ